MKLIQLKEGAGAEATANYIDYLILKTIADVESGDETVKSFEYNFEIPTGRQDTRFIKRDWFYGIPATRNKDLKENTLKAIK